MHELAISRAVLDAVLATADGRRVHAIDMNVGALRQVVPDSLAFSFALVARGTLCDGASLRIAEIPARLRCGGCEAEWELDAPRFRCPRCGDAAEVVSGEQLEVESIEVEERACIAAP